MRTNIVIDDQLMRDALRASGLKTKREAVEDSSVWADCFTRKSAPQTDKLNGLLGYESLAIGDLIPSEVLQAFDSDRDFKAAQDHLLHSDRDFDAFAAHLSLSFIS